MSEDTLSSKTVARELPGLLKDFMKKVLGQNGEEWLCAFKLFLRKKNPWPEQVAKAIKKVSVLLETLKTTVKLPGASTFRAIDHLQITPNDERETAELVIGYVGDNLRANFLSNGGKVEENVPESALRAHKLKKDSLDIPIIAELGGEAVVETTLSEMVSLMRRQGRGQNGILLTNGWANIFYIRDTKGTLWAVYCRWDSVPRFWRVGATSVTNPDRWNAGSQVFSRDSGS